jgi:anti-sigma regulatory factor (Ser/Thr protein kinase)
MIYRQKLLVWVRNRKSFTSKEVSTRFKVSRQTAALHLKELVESGHLQKNGSTRSATYIWSRAQKPPKPLELRLVKKISHLKEDQAFEEIQNRLPLKKQVSKNVQSILYYAFTEMLNNAIDHSQSKECRIYFQIKKNHAYFSIEDHGVGVFTNVKKGFHLEDEVTAAHHLFKGKQTTQPSHHSGQGIFFTSRIADQFILSSHRLQAKLDNEKEDFLILPARYHKGTKVFFSIKIRSKKRIDKLFRDFANEDFEFDRNLVRVRLVGDELVSRSQARRFVSGLEAFERITFDFQKVKGIGQAFADEIFRVFQNRYPHIKLEVINANSTIQFMIARAI